MPELAEPVSAIHSGGFVQLGIDACKRRKKDDRTPTGFFPDDLACYKAAEPSGRHQKLNLLPAHRSNGFINQAAFRCKEQVGNRYDHHPGHKVGNINHGLHNSLVPFHPKFV